MKTFQLRNMDPLEIMPGFFGRMVHSENMTFAHWDIKSGSLLPEHSHPHEQVVNMINGKFELVVDGQSQILRSQQVAIIPSNAKHSGRALTDCHIIDVFYPIREDYR